jgi:hypothetical protein
MWDSVTNVVKGAEPLNDERRFQLEGKVRRDR